MKRRLFQRITAVFMIMMMAGGVMGNINIVSASEVISATMVPTYKVVISNGGNGTVAADKAEYNAGDRVKLTVVASERFNLAGLSAYETKDIASETIDIFNDKGMIIEDDSFIDRKSVV